MNNTSLTEKDGSVSTSKAAHSIIHIGTKSLDAFVMPDGSYRMSQAHISECVGKAKTDARLFLQKHFPDEILDLVRVSGNRAGRGGTRIRAVSICHAVEYWQYQACAGNAQALDLLAQLSQSPPPGLEAFRGLSVVTALKRRRKQGKYCEKWYAQRLQSQIGGRSEVLTPAGLIDLLTATQVVEIKTAKNWKEAIGQVLVYSAYYPSHEKRVHLFGDCHSSMLDMIQGHCQRLNILLTWETR